MVECRRCDRWRVSVIVAAATAALIFLAGGAGAWAQSGQKTTVEPGSGVNARSQLQKLEAELKKRQARHKNLSDKAAKAASEQARIRRRLINAGRNAKQRGLNLLRAERRLRELKQQEIHLNDSLLADRQRLSMVLGALSRLARRPEPILAAETSDILDSLRASILLSSVVPELRARADRLQQRLKTIDKLRLNISRQKITIAKAQSGLETERARIKRLLTLKILEKKRLQGRASRERQRLRLLALDASDLRDLIEKIRLSAQAARQREMRIRQQQQRQQLAALDRDSLNETQNQKIQQNPIKSPTKGTIAALDKATDGRRGDSIRRRGTLAFANAPFSKAKGLVQLPVAGRIIRRFGEIDKHGLHAKGIRIKVRAGSQIVAPYDGEVAFAGPFRGYGLLLIIAHGEGYYTLLSGISRSHVVVGQLVLANEPIGEMVGKKENGKNGNLTLYVELRWRGEAINPQPWMAARSDRVAVTR